MTTAKVSNLVNANGNKVANQFNIETESQGETACYFQSYDTVIAKNENGLITLDVNWNQSATTTKYLKLWLGFTGTTNQLINKIVDGTYETDNLN